MPRIILARKEGRRRRSVAPQSVMLVLQTNPTREDVFAFCAVFQILVVARN